MTGPLLPMPFYPARDQVQPPLFDLPPVPALLPVPDRDGSTAPTMFHVEHSDVTKVQP